MRQDGNRACLPSLGDRQAAAPLNAEPRWPEGYIRVLREAGAQEKTIPYCVGIEIFSPGVRRGQRMREHARMRCHTEELVHDPPCHVPGGRLEAPLLDQSAAPRMVCSTCR